MSFVQFMNHSYNIPRSYVSSLAFELLNAKPPISPASSQASDGKLEVLTKSRKKELNAPSEDQLDSKPDLKGNVDYFKEVEVGDAKEVDWRRKLGGMLIREVGGQEHADSTTE
ncbi:MAG: hypothetical protein LQ352_006095 [Teloschistes flavicans]|nr:MAG: hypothetical protein LQ352_006095 [Teloschistes flavicans]